MAPYVGSSVVIRGTTTIETYCNVAAVALLIYETCITLDREAQHIWRRRASAAAWIFLLNRYLTMLSYFVGVLSASHISGDTGFVVSTPRMYLAHTDYTPTAAHT
ncbi:hypothetical protein C8Q78DRAFT_1077180 [Trametes maxima]|nr:hypothetical protein C8Q78DRAFT_1077180 [Trametes maxima]